MHPLAQLDHRYLWHPFTQMRDWLKHEPVVIMEGEGAVLRDSRGREYLDANSSIWTNLHGHNHPRMNAAIQRQLGKIAHSSALGLANEPASLLAGKLIELTNPRSVARANRITHWPRRNQTKADHVSPSLAKTFFSDDGSTAMEVALKLAYEFARRTGRSRKPKFLSLAGAYHGDTIGAVALGHIDLFHRSWSRLLFKTDTVMAPYCYRCRFNRAKPERADARDYRKCNWECLDVLEKKFATQKKTGNPYAAFVFEPLIQGAAGMIPQPPGWLHRAAEISRAHGAQLIADEVMTGFGRTGSAQISEKAGARVCQKAPGSQPSAAQAKVQRSQSDPSLPACMRSPPLFACQHEEVQPDFLALAKGLTGGYLPMAATLTTQAVFDAFLGEYEEFKTFFHGHSYTGNQLGAAAALASLEILESSVSLRARQKLEYNLRQELQTLWELPNIGDIRQVGLIVGIELVKDWTTREPFELRKQAGLRVCQSMARQGVLTRPIGNVVVLMPPYCATSGQVRQMVRSLHQAVSELGAISG
jgi:adenosylmethionine-8-amino-7-oxononanoate aminotransferase